MRLISTKIITAIIVFGCCSTFGKEYSFTKVLDYYGFADEKQKEAIQDLLQKANIISANTTLNQAFPIRKSKEEVASDIINILQKIQEKFVARSSTQERWQAKPLEWINYDELQILADLKILGFVDAIKSKQKNIDAFCILGGGISSMKDRIEHTNSLIKTNIHAKTIILLAGERYVTGGRNSTKVQLKKIASKFHLSDWTKLTETHLIQHEYSKSPLSNNKDIEVHVIDTPRGDLPRPTTQTTVIKLIEWLKDHKEIQNIIFVSNQPYVKYQKAIIDSVFKENNINIKYEVVGDAIQNFNQLQPIIEALGTYIWVSTPAILTVMNIRISNEQNKKLLRQLYPKNLLIHKTISQSLSNI